MGEIVILPPGTPQRIYDVSIWKKHSIESDANCHLKWRKKEKASGNR
jgi:hypothetical protein